MANVALVNVAPVDRWTLAHAGFGAIYGLIKLPWWAALGLGFGFEILEIGLKRHVPAIFPRPRQDSVLNATFDVAAVMVGWGIGKALREL